MAFLNPQDPGLGTQLGQSNPGVTTTVQASVGQASDIEIKIETVMIVNNNDSPAMCEIYHDDSGTTFDNTTRIFRSSVPGDSTVQIDNFNAYVSSSISNIAVNTAIIDDVTFTFYGTTKDI